MSTDQPAHAPLELRSWAAAAFGSEYALSPIQLAIGGAVLDSVWSQGIAEGRRQTTEQAAQILDPEVVQAYGTDIQTLVGAAVRISHQDGWRQATEGWGAQWGIVAAPGRLPRAVDDVHEARALVAAKPGSQLAVRPAGKWTAPLVRHASPYCGCGINTAGARFVDPICRLVGPWEPAEQDVPAEGGDHGDH